MGNGCTIRLPHPTQCASGQRVRTPTDWIVPGYPIRNRPGWGRRIGLGTPPPTNHQRKGEERERERDPHHELAIQFMVCSAQDVPRKEGGVLAIFWGGLFRPVCRPHVHFLPLKGGKCRPFLFWGLFRAVCQPHVHFLPLLGCLICLGPQIVPKTGQDHRHFFGGCFLGPLPTASAHFHP